MANEPNKGNMPDQNKGKQDQWKGGQSQGQPNKGGQQGGQSHPPQGGQHQGNKQDQERNR